MIVQNAQKWIHKIVIFVNPWYCRQVDAMLLYYL